MSKRQVFAKECSVWIDSEAEISVDLSKSSTLVFRSEKETVRSSIFLQPRPTQLVKAFPQESFPQESSPH